jgi:hypothetical protein
MSSHFWPVPLSTAARTSATFAEVNRMKHSCSVDVETVTAHPHPKVRATESG